MGEMRVDAHGDDLRAARFEIVNTVVERDDLRRAHEGEVERVKEQYADLAVQEFLQIEVFFDLVVGQHGFRSKVWGGFADKYAHG